MARCHLRPQQRQRVHVESLEDRRLLSASVADLLARGFQPVEFNGQHAYARPGEWIVRLDGVEGTGVQQLAKADRLVKSVRADLAVTEHLGADGLLLLESSTDTSFGQLRRLLGKLRQFKFVEPNFAIRLQATHATDPAYWRLYGQHNAGQTAGTIDADIDAPEAWDITKGSSDVVVAVIDSGVNYNHADLTNSMWRNPGEIAGDGLDNDGNGVADDVYGFDAFNLDGNPLDDQGHGTHVAGTIAADDDNGIGVTGVAPNVKLMAVKITDAFGFGSVADCVRGVHYVNVMAERGVNVVVSNASWGGDPYTQALFDAIARHRDNGILFVAAAGNGNIFGIPYNNDTTPFYPANYALDNIISVAATDQNDQRAFFSNYGAATVDLGAPGVGIYSTLIGGGYGNKDGTSMAAPHVTGVVALAASAAPGASYASIRNAILEGVDPVPSLAGITVTGGRLNAHNALQRLLPPTAAHDAPTNLRATVVSPTQVNLAWADNSGNESGFKVYRADNGGGAVLVGTAGANVKSFSDMTLPASGGTFAYAVVASNDLGDSAASNVVTIVTVSAPVAPSGLVATALSGSQIRLSWQDNASNESGFQIERSTNRKTWTGVGGNPTAGANATSYTDSGLARRTRYYYRVRAVNTAGVSAWSNLADARTTSSSTIVAAIGTTTGVSAGGSALFSSVRIDERKLIDDLIVTAI